LCDYLTIFIYMKLNVFLMMKEKGVSDVIGTLLMLAITVTLFSSVFYYVSTLPPPPSQIYSSFQVKYLPDYTNGTFILYIENSGGESLNAMTTKMELIGIDPSFYYGIPFSDPRIVSQLNSNYFEPGKTVVFKSWWANIPPINQKTSINLFLIDTLNNQLVYSALLQGVIKSMEIVGFSYTPMPFYSNQPITAHFYSYVIYNPNNNVLPKLTISIPAFKINGTMQYYSPFVYTYPASLVNLAVGNYTAYINASLGSYVSHYKGIITVKPSLTGPYALRITSISLSVPDPVHGSTDMIFISVSNPSGHDESFKILLQDYYPYNNSKYNISTNLGDPFPEKIAAYSSTSFVVTWYNVGGNGFAEGNHTLFGTILNPDPQIPASGNYVNLTVMPRILLVDDEAQYTDTPNSVFNYYYNILNYMDYNMSTEILPSIHTPITISDYDLVIWITGYSQSGIGTNQSYQITNFVNNYGGSFLMIGNYYSEFNGIFGSDISTYSQTIPQTTIKYGNFTKISPNTINIPVNMTGNINPGNPNISSSNNVLFFTGSIIHYLASLPSSENPNNYPSAAYGLSGNGRFVLIGYELTRMFLYQQYYILNKAMMWLSNISVRQHLYDLALVDMELSTHNPLFLQPVNITFYIMNLSPGPFGNGNTILEYSIGNKQYFASVGNITMGNGSIVKLTVSWTATLSPGVYPISAYLNYYHSPSEVNYNNNVLNNLVNINIYVKYSVLVVWVHRSSDNNNITGVTGALKNLGVSYTFLDFNEKAVTLPKNFNTYFEKFNLVIIDFNNTGKLSGYKYAVNLSDAIYYYLMNPNVTIYPYSLLFLGERAGYALSTATRTSNNVNLLNLLDVINIQSGSNTPNNPATLYGLSYSNVNVNLNNFQMNVTDGYGFLYDYSSYWNLITLTNPDGIAILGGAQYPVQPSPIYTGRAVIENLSSVTVGIVPYDFENIAGLIQSHTYQYSPQYTSSNPIYYQPPNPVQYTKNMFMMNLLLAFKYHFSTPIPYIPSTRISINSPYVSLNNYYLISGVLRNLGDVPTTVVLQSYEESSIFSSETIYLPAESNIPFQVIWKPTYASSPNPEILRFVVNTGGSAIQTPMQEAVIYTPTYFFYDDFSGGVSQNWIHYADAFAYSGVSWWRYFSSGLTSETHDFIPGEPYSIFGPVDNIFNSGGIGYYNGNPMNSWNLYQNGYSGGYSLGISWNVNSNNGQWASPVYVLETNSINIKGSTSAYFEFYATFQLAFAAEGVLLFISHDQGTWYWIPPVGGYHDNGPWENLGNLTGNYLYPVAGQTLTPMFVGVSGGGLQPQWTFYKFNLDYSFVDQNGNTVYINASQWQTLYVEFVFIGDNSYNGGNINVYGNDNFYFDDFKIIERGPIYPQSSVVDSGTSGDTWSIINGNQVGLSSNIYGYYVSITPDTIDNLVSIPIDLVNAISVNMNFLTAYSIWARFSYAGDPTDVPNGFRLYIGVSSGNGVSWTQMDTRWAGEAGIVSLSWASTIPSVYYPGIGAFSSQVGPYIDLSAYAGQTIFIKFEVNGDYSQEFHGTFGLVQSVSSDWVFITDVIVSGYSLYTAVSVSSTWT